MTQIQPDQGASKALEAVQGSAPARGGTSLRELIAQQTDEIRRALPRTLTAERFVRVIQTELRKNPKLAEGTAASFLGAVLTAAQLGLEFGPVGRAYMVPFKNKKLGVTEIQLIIGYKGWLDLIHRSGELASISAREVRANDTFTYQFGLNEDLVHVPASGERGEVTHYYCVAKTKNGGANFAVMSRAEVEKHRDRYARRDFNGNITGPWQDNFDEMALKTVFKKVYTWLPMSTEMADANAVDEGMIYRTSLADTPEIIDIEEVEEVEAPITKAAAVAPAPRRRRSRAVKSEEPSRAEVVTEVIDAETGEVVPERAPTGDAAYEARVAYEQREREEQDRAMQERMARMASHGTAAATAPGDDPERFV